jgi:hypothetical protein
MVVQEFLEETLKTCRLPPFEEESIEQCARQIEGHTIQHFRRHIRSVVRFGSSTRGTVLPRPLDETADVDFLILFSGIDLTPSACLNRTLEFANEHFGNRIIEQSTQSLSLILNGNLVDFVPATMGRYGEIRIPDSSGGWMMTDPKGFHARLADTDNAHDSMIRPTILLMKYWNARNGRPVEPFKLEQWICNLKFRKFSNQRDYFYSSLYNLVSESIFWHQGDMVRQKLDETRLILYRLIQSSKFGTEKQAERDVKSLFAL